MRALSLASPARDGGCATAAAALESGLGVIEVRGGGVGGLEAEVAALAAQVAGGGFHPGGVVELRP